jgi:predicted ATPase
MITSLDIKNFKVWRNTKKINFAPITVFFGANSAGKTSIPQLLLLLKQTAESPDRQRALQLGDSLTLIDLGTYVDAVHNHDIEQPLEFELGWTLDEQLIFIDPLSKTRFGGNAINLHVVIKADKRDQPLVHSFRYELSSDNQVSLDVTMERRSDGKFNLSSTKHSLVRHSGRAWPPPEPIRFYGFPDEVTAYFQNTAFTSDLVLRFERMLRSIFYVGPLRDYPKRFYHWSGETLDHVGVKGARAIEAILASGKRSFNLKAKERKKPLAALVAERLQSMGLIKDFQVKPLGQNRKEYEVLVRTSSKMPEVKLTDVGFGVSQVLPVIVESFYVPRRSIVIFEQPEIHLHPKVQAELADLFVDAIHARENGIERDCQFIIESHSEHFLRRLQRRIAEKKLAARDAALYFVRTQGDSARIEKLDIDKYGNIRNWPDDFFGDEMGDLVARAEAQAKRMR